MAAFANKSALKTKAADYFARSDLDFDFLISEAEATINPQLLPVRERENEGLPFALNTDAETNWLLANGPNVYWAALLVEAFAYERNASDDAALWQARLQSAIENLIWENARDTTTELSIDPALILSAGAYDITTDGASSSSSSSDSEDPDAFILD